MWDYLSCGNRIKRRQPAKKSLRCQFPHKHSSKAIYRRSAKCYTFRQIIFFRTKKSKIKNTPKPTQALGSRAILASYPKHKKSYRIVTF